ncbi:MAG: hypothetical protein H0V76_05845 [Blastocatellia bacterium]|nr:hypothetical protein [Blastocatellia bacterium]
MLDKNLIETLEQSLHQTRNAQNRLIARLREIEDEGEHLREEIRVLENMASQTESAIDSLLVSMRSGSRSFEGDRPRLIEGDRDPIVQRPRNTAFDINSEPELPSRRRTATPGTVSYFNQSRVPSRTNNPEPVSHRFADRTITQACTLLLRESGRPLHVNELYNLLVAGGMQFKGNNPTISIAVSLNRNRRFRKVEPGTFDLVIREASQRAS